MSASDVSHVKFEVPEYQSDGTFQTASYEFQSVGKDGWKVQRNGSEVLCLGEGYALLKTKCCAVCSTDLARRFLPYPLPAITGHEVLAHRDEQLLAVEINASHLTRALPAVAECAFCRSGISSHCPQRITLGIDRLPGGFAPWVLAPVDACIPVPQSIDPLVACLTEPFAAALQGVEATLPLNGEEVAVVGPRRLGMLLVVALHGFRRLHGLSFRITAVGRHQKLLDLALQLGADEGIDTSKTNPNELANRFDIVYDTTGKPEGFDLCLGMARKVLHLKSTNGVPVLGMTKMTEAVVDELALLPYSTGNLAFDWPFERGSASPSSRSRLNSARTNPNVLITATVPQVIREEIVGTGRKVHCVDVQDVSRRLMAYDNAHPLNPNAAASDVEEFFPEGSPLPRFDLAVVTTLAEADDIIRPLAGEVISAVRPRGAILFVKDPANTNPLVDAIINRGLEIHSSRCGNFRRAIKVLSSDTELRDTMQRLMITHTFPLQSISEAFEVAANSRESVKVVVDTAPK